MSRNLVADISFPVVHGAFNTQHVCGVNISLTMTLYHVPVQPAGSNTHPKSS